MDKTRLLKSDCTRLGVLMGLCLALGVYLIATTVLISKDGVFYIGQAQAFPLDPLGVTQRHPPGYPVLLWIAHATAGLFIRSDSVSSWIHVSQSITLLCRVLTLIPLYFLGKSLVGGARAFWAVLILIVLPYPARFGSDVLRDWPYVLFLSMGFWLLYWALRRQAWWMFSLVGLNTAVAYSIQPAATQLVIYALLGFAIVLRRDAESCVCAEGRPSRPGPLAAAALLVAGFAGPVLPFAFATGTLIPHPLRPPTFNSPPVIVSVGGKGASRDPLEFEIREGELLGVGIEASDSPGDDLKFSLAAVPAGSRPVYQFRLTASGDRFVTISDDEKDTLLEMYPPAVRDYDGIVCYAYARADVRSDLEPVHRLWSPGRQRHLYTTSLSEKDALLAESSKGLWTYEGIAFYAFAEGRQPPDAVPVRRFANMETVPDNDTNKGEVTWCVHMAGKPPAGMSMEGRTLRWRPGPGQRGEYGINLIVSDGELESCQLMKMTVVGPEMAVSGPLTAPPPANPQAAIGNPQSTYAGLGRLPGAVDRLFDGFAESLMVFFLAPWCVGLYYRMRHDADALERVLMTAVIVVNAGLMLGRYVWVAPTMERRYCLPLVALTIFYVPIGLEHIALWLSRKGVSGDEQLSSKQFSRWFLILALIGIGICLPKLLMPRYAEMDCEVKAIQWLRDRTHAVDVIAVPDSRLTFYAQRTGLVYRGVVDPRRADYIVRIAVSDAVTPPSDWSQEYSVPTHDRRGRILTIYKTHRRRG